MKRALFALLVLLPAPLVAQDGPGLYLQGDVRMGVVWDRPAPAPGSDRAEARLYARSQLKLKFIGETDGGLRYGAEIDLDKLNATGAANPGGQSVFIGN
ncbi:porin [Roseinatronobacter ekhonensis]|nr:porin [Roseibaca ekhonensis]